MADHTTDIAPQAPCAPATNSSTRNNLHPELLRGAADESCVPDDLEVLCCLVEGRAIEAIDWYLARKKWPKRFSQWIRFFAILFAVAGGSQPFLDSLDGFKDYGNWGFVLLGISGALILIDKLFGLSSAWMRYITTQLRLQELLAEFQMDWVMLRAETNGQPSEDQHQQMLARLKAFRMAVWEEIRGETEIWVAEFKSSLAHLEKRAQAQAETERSASLRLRVENTAGIDGNTLDVFIDDRPRSKVVNGTAVIKNLRPGVYAVRLAGKRAGNPVMVSDSVVLAPGEVGQLRLELP